MCDDQTVLQHNYEMKLINDDYKGARTAEEQQKALADFIERAFAPVLERARNDGCRPDLATCLPLKHAAA